MKKKGHRKQNETKKLEIFKMIELLFIGRRHFAKISRIVLFEVLRIAVMIHIGHKRRLELPQIDLIPIGDRYEPEVPLHLLTAHRNLLPLEVHVIEATCRVGAIRLRSRPHRVETNRRGDFLERRRRL